MGIRSKLYNGKRDFFKRGESFSYCYCECHDIDPGVKESLRLLFNALVKNHKAWVKGIKRKLVVSYCGKRDYIIKLLATSLARLSYKLNPGSHLKYLGSRSLPFGPSADSLIKNSQPDLSLANALAWLAFKIWPASLNPPVVLPPPSKFHLDRLPTISNQFNNIQESKLGNLSLAKQCALELELKWIKDSGIPPTPLQKDRLLRDYNYAFPEEPNPAPTKKKVKK